MPIGQVHHFAAKLFAYVRQAPACRAQSLFELRALAAVAALACPGEGHLDAFGHGVEVGLS